MKLLSLSNEYSNLLVQTKYIIPEEGRDWVLKTLDDNWRVYKSRVKSKHYNKYKNDEERIRNKPATIPLEQFKVLMKYWSDEAIQKRASKNLANRKKVTDTHTAGRTSFAQIRSEMV